MNFWNDSGWEQLYKVIGAMTFWFLVIKAALYILETL